MGISTNIIALLQAGGEYLDTCGVAEAKTEADLLLAHILGTSRDRLYLDRDREISAELRERYNQFLLKRGKREPLAYLLNRREFMGLDFYVDKRVLIPRPETELLVEKTMELGKNSDIPLKILDLCTGSGALAITIAHFLPGSSVTAVDISCEALEVASINAQRRETRIDFRQGDLFQAVQGERFDLIVSNPPYVSEEEYASCMEEVKKEPSLALLGGRDGLDFYRRIAIEAKRYLKPRGIILMEIGCRQGDHVTQLFSEKGYNTVVFPDYAGLDRIVMAEKE